MTGFLASRPISASSYENNSEKSMGDNTVKLENFNFVFIERYA